MKNNYLLLLLSFTIVTLSCCKPDDDSEPQVYHFLLPQEVKDYYAFKDGTYWVYENDKTKELDSITVFFHQSKIDTIIDTERNHKLIFEIFRLITYSHRDDYKTEYYPLPPVPENPSANAVIIEREKYKTGDYIGVTSLLFHPFIKGSKKYTSKGEIVLNDILPEFTIKNNSFLNVLYYHNTFDITNNKSDMDYFIAKNVGIVMMRNNTTNETWNLIRHNIVQ